MIGLAGDSRDLDIGKRIRAYRLERRYSQSKLAQLLGIAFQQVQKYENGTNRISASRLQKIAEIFSLPVAVLHGEAHANRGKSAGVDKRLLFLTSASALRLAEAYSKIKNTKARAALVILAEQLVAT